ncbi:tetratricopeptide repeat protein [Microbulbifer pacificus]|uniref:Multiheme c-type cytochrome n=1 Tax=Microbulbifer pacificus TaxID=407164 RepID=A0AAU0MXC4_9GAMM|nr:tetratricopeptide repeat protein [Microbulbifer pacificus]WOX05154.1 multiheme c-type cytochrome [Microbulbifer pacificus]
MRKLLCFLLPALLMLGCDKQSSPVDHRDTLADKDKPVPAAVVEATQTEVEAKAPNLAKRTYMGAETCAGCHASEFQSWQKSHHDMAMKLPTPETVVGNFDNAEFDYFGTVSHFFKRGDKYVVRTDGPDGKLQDFAVAYTFGIEPLQQYLIELPGGKLQALSIAWDSRSKEVGGQRWFHLYPNEEIKPGDPLHWTGLNQNWNFMCADCHSTNFQKNYDTATKTFSSAWSEINVGCEACHGPASRHVDWANAPEDQRGRYGENLGLEVSYRDRLTGAWQMNLETGIAQLLKNAGGADIQKEIQTCAQCHSRRSTAFPGAHPQSNFLDHFNPALLSDGLYHADGQINDEVYVYGSFLQSKMHGAGVTCSNCHNPHTLKVRAEGNALCAQCHLPQKFDTAEHHMHKADTQGAQCVSCHMPEKTYMQVDARRDHSFRVPRPDLSLSIGSPNACVGCHSDKTDSWAAQVLEKKYGKPKPHYGEALFAGRIGAPDAEGRLLKLAMDDTQPEIVRATAVSMLPQYLSQTSAQVLQVIAQGDDALLHLGLAQSLENVPERIRPALAIPLLYEDEKVVTALAANAMAGAPMAQYPEEVRRQFNNGLVNYQRSEDFNSDRPESLANLAGMYFQQGQPAKSEKYFRDAIDLEPSYSPAYINLADLYRATGREQESEQVLREALAAVNDKTPVEHSLGLSLVRQKKMSEALEYLRAAAHSTTAPSHYVYVYAIGLNSLGKSNEAIKELEQALERFPGDRQIISALASIHHEQGNGSAAQQYQQQLQ